jgi:hypothetical protein
MGHAPLWVCDEPAHPDDRRGPAGEAFGSESGNRAMDDAGRISLGGDGLRDRRMGGLADAAQPPSLKAYYLWAIGLVLAGAIAAVFLGPVPQGSLGVLAGGMAGLLPTATWHWMLARRRRWWTYVLVMAGKLTLMFGGLWILFRTGWAPPGALVAGIALAVFGSLPFAFGRGRV